MKQLSTTRVWLYAIVFVVTLTLIVARFEFIGADSHSLWFNVYKSVAHLFTGALLGWMICHWQQRLDAHRMGYTFPQSMANYYNQPGSTAFKRAINWHLEQPTPWFLLLGLCTAEIIATLITLLT